MDRAQKTVKARKLRDQGMTYQQIADRLGYKNVGTPWKLLHPESARKSAAKTNRKRHQAKLAWQHERDHSPEGRSRCPECGGLMGVGTARRPIPDRCAECVHKGALAKYATLERLWGEGKTLPEIQAELGWTKGHVSAYIQRARAEGYNLPYRHKFANPVFS